jgi:GNAT superfamily N-acetyltransferase
MTSVDEVAELHRLSGRALVASMGEAPGVEMRLTPSCAMCLTSENVADFNMVLLGPPTSDAESFLDEAVARADARGLDLLALMAPAVAAALAPAAERHGLVAAGSIPLMVLRGSADLRHGRSCHIEDATDRKTARIAGDLISAAFQLPRDSVARVIEPNVTPTSAASVYVAYAGETPMSTVTITRVGATAGVWSMATPPEHQGKGMGRALLSRIIERLRHEGVERFYLFATAAGFPLYSSLGFVTLTEEAAWVKGHSTQTHA